MTVPFKASSRTFAEIVVLIGTPNLLSRKINKFTKTNQKNHQKDKIFGRKTNLNNAANIVLTVPRLDKSISISIPSASRALKLKKNVKRIQKWHSLSIVDSRSFISYSLPKKARIGTQASNTNCLLTQTKITK